MDEDKLYLGPESPADRERSQGAKNPRKCEDKIDLISLGTLTSDTVKAEKTSGTSKGDTTTSDDTYESLYVKESSCSRENRASQKMSTDDRKGTSKDDTVHRSSAPRQHLPTKPPKSLVDGKGLRILANISLKTFKKKSAAQRRRLARKLGLKYTKNIEKQLHTASETFSMCDKKDDQGLSDQLQLNQTKKKQQKLSPECLQPKYPEKPKKWFVNVVKAREEVYSKIENNPLATVAINSNDPDGVFSFGQYVLVTNHLTEQIAEVPVEYPGDFIPRFHSFKHIQGLLLFECVDEATGEWLTTLSFSGLWDSINIKLMFKRDFSNLVTCRASFLGPIRSTAEIFDLLSLQNTGLNTSLWCVERRTEGRKQGVKWIVSIDEVSIEYLKSIDMRPFYGISRAYVRIVDKSIRETEEEYLRSYVDDFIPYNEDEDPNWVPPVKPPPKNKAKYGDKSQNCDISDELEVIPLESSSNSRYSPDRFKGDINRPGHSKRSLSPRTSYSQLNIEKGASTSTLRKRISVPPYKSSVDKPIMSKIDKNIPDYSRYSSSLGRESNLNSKNRQDTEDHNHSNLADSTVHFDKTRDTSVFKKLFGEKSTESFQKVSHLSNKSDDTLQISDKNSVFYKIFPEKKESFQRDDNPPNASQGVYQRYETSSALSQNKVPFQSGNKPLSSYQGFKAASASSQNKVPVQSANNPFTSYQRYGAASVSTQNKVPLQGSNSALSSYQRYEAASASSQNKVPFQRGNSPLSSYQGYEAASASSQGKVPFQRGNSPLGSYQTYEVSSATSENKVPFQRGNIPLSSYQTYRDSSASSQNKVPFQRGNSPLNASQSAYQRTSVSSQMRAPLQRGNNSTGASQSVYQKYESSLGWSQNRESFQRSNISPNTSQAAYQRFEPPSISQDQYHYRSEDTQDSHTSLLRAESSLTTQKRRSPVTHRSRSPLVTQRSRSPLVTQRSRSPLVIRRSRSPLTTRRSRSPLTTRRSRSPLTRQSRGSLRPHRSRSPPKFHDTSRRIASPSNTRYISRGGQETSYRSSGTTDYSDSSYNTSRHPPTSSGTRGRSSPSRSQVSLKRSSPPRASYDDRYRYKK